MNNLRNTLIIGVIISVIAVTIYSWTCYSEIENKLNSLENENQNLHSVLESMELLLQSLNEELKKAHYIGIQKIIATAYNSEKAQTDSDPYVTASGEIVQRGTLALSRDMINAKSKFMKRMGYNPIATIS